jgi:hypothetical protein
MDVIWRYFRKGSGTPIGTDDVVHCAAGFSPQVRTQPLFEYPRESECGAFVNLRYRRGAGAK